MDESTLNRKRCFKVQCFREGEQGRQTVQKAADSFAKESQTSRQRSRGGGAGGELRPFSRAVANLTRSCETSSSSWSRSHILKSRITDTQKLLFSSGMEFHIR